MPPAGRTGRRRSTEPDWLGRQPVVEMDIVAPVLAYLGCVAGILTTYAMALYLVFAPPNQLAQANHKAAPSAVIQKGPFNPHKRA